MKLNSEKIQRFSIRKYSFGAASVAIAAFLMFGNAQVAQANETKTEAESQSGQSTNIPSKEDTRTSVVAESSVSISTYQANPATITSKDVATTPTSGEATEKTQEIAKDARISESETKSTRDAEVSTQASSVPASATPAKASEVKGQETSQAVSNPENKASLSVQTEAAQLTEQVKPANSNQLENVVPTLETNQEVLTNAGALATEGGRRRSRRSADAPTSTSYTEGTAVATPTMSDANGATVKNREFKVPPARDNNTIPTADVDFRLNPDNDRYTFVVTDLKNFNATYNTKYYYRMSKPYDNSNNVRIELIDGSTNTVVETKDITGPTTFTLGEKILKEKANNEAAYLKFTVTEEKDSSKETRTAIRGTWNVTNAEAVAKGFNGQRSALQLFDVINSANEGTTITDPQYYVPRVVEHTTKYYAVDKNADTYQSTRIDGTDTTTQSYKKTGNEVSLGTYTVRGLEGQIFTASNVRGFQGYQLYQTADETNKTGELRKTYVVGTRWFDVQNGQGGVKRLKEIVAEDGTVKVEIWTIKPEKASELATIKDDANKKLDTTDFIKVYEVTLPPGTDSAQIYPQDLGKKLTVDGYSEGSFEIKNESGNAGNVFAAKNLTVNGVLVANGNLFRLQNNLTKAPVVEYFYDKVDPTEVTLEVAKKLEGRAITNGEFSFKLKEESSTPTSVEQTKTNTGEKVTFDKITYTQAGTYTYKITEVAGKDTDVDYDAMEITATVEVTKNAKGNLEAKVTYKGTGGFAASEDDTEFNNYYVAPVTAQFDFSKALSGRTLKDGEFSFVLKDSNGTVLQTKKNDAQGKVSFDALSFTNTQVGTHKYTVEEVIPSEKEAGMTYDTMKAEVTVTVTKSGHTLAAVNTLPADTEFNNNFTPAATNAQFKFTKKLENGTLAADAFEFELLENGQVLQTKKNAADGSITFDAISYATEGTHTYTVREKSGSDTNIDYDDMIAEVKVVVTKDATTGLLNTTVTLPSDTEFNNYYVAPVDINLDFSKKLKGRELTAGEFSFVLKDSTGKVVQTVQNDATGKITFDKLSYQNGQEGVYNYTVEEVAGTDTTVTYDNMIAKIAITVTKNGHALATTVTYTNENGKDADGSATTGKEDKEFNNVVTPPEKPKFQPEKYVVSKEKYDITGNKLVDDDSELTDKYEDTNKDPYADKSDNNEAENINTKTVKHGEKIVYQVWLDTTKFDTENKQNITAVEISDRYDADKLTVNAADIKAYDSVTGEDVTAKFDITVENSVIKAVSKTIFTSKSLGDAENTKVIDTTQFAFGRYYKFDIPATVKDTVKGGSDIENTASQVVHQYDATKKTVTPSDRPTEKRVNNVPISVEFNFTKKLEGRELKAGEFSFRLKDEQGNVLETVSNDAFGNVKFSAIEYKKGQEGTYTYTVEEVKGTDATVSYDTMKAVVTVEVRHDGTAKALITNVTDPADKEFNNKVTPPEEPKFQPEKYVVNKEKFDITGDKLLDDDKELKDKVADTNANPYADKSDNNEAENLNTKTLRKGDKVYYQVWLDTRNFTEAHNIQSIGVTDKYDSENLDVNVADIKAYDSVTGEDVTAKFDITLVNGVITATSKSDFTKSLGDAENTQVIDTAKLAFGRYYKFEIPATIKESAKDGVDIENTASQVVHQYDATKKTVTPSDRPTEKRVVNIPVKVEFNFTKKLEGRTLKVGEFTFVLKDADGKVIETVSNDADGKIKFSALEYKKGQEGTYTYTVEEVKGTEAGIEYDKMVAQIKIIVAKDGKALVVSSQLPEDMEFNNIVTPPTPSTPPTPPTPPTPLTATPKSELPNTGTADSSATIALGVMAAVAGLGLMAKRRREDEI
ncbi:hypothetical protein SORDD14_01857 [Streptococcus oralis]|uniref:Gram-positive cocci surface proteins LPxTG domain-containing protein n=1 Tax=Streptococcus oralis TaxID=1303 RepID=A0A139NTJ1_STROR|nr:FctA domain-containing protein [Streptococcus oralis]KXT79340.1 hypothetical protein SORDD14_01857 [Streptococcus oralis]